jgi:16S rRNA A1518/A1519 N6-dimethyltransferase RsmA/KsgA/DIM1 with predicted DNA glycosylase/AP lyase activity
MVIRVNPLRPEPLTKVEEEELRELTRLAFQQRRKQFQAILRNHPATKLSREAVARLEDRTGLNLTQRPETFSPEEFLSLSRALKEES